MVAKNQQNLNRISFLTVTVTLTFTLFFPNRRLNSCSINLNIEPINCEQLLKMYRINEKEHGRGRHVPHGLFCDLYLSHLRWAHVRAFG